MSSVHVGTDWEWRGRRLWNRKAVWADDPASRSQLKRWFVSLVYADQNRSSAVRRTLDRLLNDHDSGLVLNVGAGSTVLPGAVNLDLHDGPTIDIIGVDETLPFKDGSVGLIILQEVLEHVAKPKIMLEEIARVLRPGGRLYCQTPFQIGFHPGPCDYWRFSRQGIEELFCDPHWQLQEVGISLGHGSGFYRIAVEFFAVTMSCVSQRLYIPVKALAALALYPLKAFDALTKYSAESDRIPGGYYCVVRRCTSAVENAPHLPV